MKLWQKPKYDAMGKTNHVSVETGPGGSLFGDLDLQGYNFSRDHLMGFSQR
jgi:hypothetical protein